MAIAGTRIPDPYYERVQDVKLAAPHRRKCLDCGYGFPTVEIPIHGPWDGGRGDCCPIHQDQKGKVVNMITVFQAESGRYSSHGLTRVFQLGGTYRRRQCPIEDCEVEGKRVRWTTAELLPSGFHVRDVSACPRCNGRTRMQRDNFSS